MLEKLFKRPYELKYHKKAPYFKEREHYLLKKEKRGYAIATLTHLARELFWISHEFPNIRAEREIITIEKIKKAADNCFKKRFKNNTFSQESYNLFIKTAKDWFQFLGCFQEPLIKSSWYTNLLNEFAAFIENDRDLAQNTIKSICWQVEQFLSWYNLHDKTIATISLSVIDNFYTQYAYKKWARSSISINVQALRSFFRYLNERKIFTNRIAEAIQGPHLYTHEDIPSGPSWEDVKILMTSMKTNRPSDIRDRSIVLLLAIYGIRSSEVSSLTLDDIDWEQNKISITNKKQKKKQVYPLITIVGNAIIEYLKSVRPKCNKREVFLTLKAPIKPLSNGVIYNTISNRITKLGIRSLQKGPHSLRHACATHLLAKGFTIEKIANFLGHKRINDTQIYAKVDLPHLRKVADFNFGGAL